MVCEKSDPLEQSLSKMKVLDLGCGSRKREGAIGIDFNQNSSADIIHDLNVFPYPFEDNTFDEIYCDNVMEHLDDVLRVSEELWRIAKPSGVIIVIVPYFRSKYAFIDPTHKHFFTLDSFGYFDPTHQFSKLYNYSTARIQCISVAFDKGFNHSSIVAKALVGFANRHKAVYENLLSSVIPMNTLTFELKVLK